MFEVGNLVRLITEEGDSEIMRVLEDHDDGVTHCAIGNDDNEAWYDTTDLELVTNTQSIQESKPMESNTPERTQEEIHEDIAKMFIQCAQYMESCLDGDNITLRIEGETNRDTMDISFIARVRYNDEVVSNNLFKSAQVAIARHTENDGLKPLQLSMHK
tara:strand:+ start:114 stop:590 length:477 start_codon:yes stop_codon:yes gene_type:complete